MPTREGVDTAAAANGVLYRSTLTSRASQSQLTRVVSMPIYRSITIRNWNTTRSCSSSSTRLRDHECDVYHRPGSLRSEDGVADIGNGVFVSSTDTDDWEPDDEVGGAAHMLFDESDVSKVGLWRADEGEPRGPSDPIVLPARETIVVLEGAVRVGVDGTTDLDLGPGDMASLPQGASIMWDADPGCKVVWVYS